MNIFNYEGEQFDYQLELLFKNIDKLQMKKELIELGLEIDNVNECVKNR